MYRMADARNVGMVGIFLNEDAVLNFPNAPPLQGRIALERLYIWEYGACPRIDHRWGYLFTKETATSLILLVQCSIEDSLVHSLLINSTLRADPILLSSSGVE